VFNEKELLRKTGLMRSYKPKPDVEEGYFDDWPPELIRKYKLKVSDKVKNEIYSNKKQKAESGEPLVVPS
jgi:hypothetical protein